MKWFDDWFEKKSEQAWNSVRNKKIPSEAVDALTSNRRNFTWESKFHDTLPVEVPKDAPLNNGCGFSFTIYPAIGGYVVEYYKKEDELTIKPTANYRKLHIITSDKDLGQEISKILTFEHIRD